MMSVKPEILKHICYTELVYERINKKLKLNLTNDAIETFISDIIKQTDDDLINLKGKNYYVMNYAQNIIITINVNTYRVITVDKISQI